MDPFPILLAGAFVTSLAGVVHSCPGIFLSPTRYTTTRASFSHVRTRYGPVFERAVRMSDGDGHPRCHCGQRPCRAPRWVFPTEGGWGGGNGVQFERAPGVEGCSEQRHAARCVSSELRCAGRLLRPVRSGVCRHTGEELPDCRQFVGQFLQESNFKHTRRGIPQSQTVYRGMNIRGDPAYVCTGIPSHEGLGQSNRRYVGIPSHGLQLRTVLI